MKKEKYITEKTTSSGRKYLQVSIKYRDIDGSRHVKNGGNFYFDQYETPSDCLMSAVLVRDELRKQISLGNVIKTTPTIKELYNNRIKYYQLSKNTLTKQDTVYRHSLTNIENTPITKVSASMLQEMINNYIQNHSRDQALRLRSIIKQIYRTAIIEGINVPMLSEVLTVPNSKVIIKRREVDITLEEFYLFLKVLEEYNGADHKARYHNEIIRSALMVMLYTGLRPQEVYALTTDDIDIKNMTININKRVGSTSSEKCTLISTKTNQSEAIIPLPDDLLPEIQIALKRAKNGLLFSTIDGEIYDSNFITSYITRVSYKCYKIYGFKFNQYRLRHLFAHNLFRSGAQPKVIQALLRHASIDMSVYYDFVNLKELSEAVNKVPTKCRQIYTNDGTAEIQQENINVLKS
ncbi:MAG: site-specific integrase [Bacilli bacterium]|nr:site-specific integrase [Bacilli bacterium]